MDLGENGLRYFLTQKQYQDLLNLGALSGEQKENLLIDAKEKSGRSANFINGILTGMFGAWMGASDFLRIQIETKLELWIVSFAAFTLGCIIGFLSYKSVSEENRKIIRNQKLKNIQLKLLYMLIEKKKSAIQKVIYRYNRLVKKDPLLLTYDSLNENKMEKIKLQLIKFTEKKVESLKFLDNNAIARINKYFSRAFKKSISSDEGAQKSHYPEYFQVLSHPHLSAPRSSKSVCRWILKSKKKILINFLPAIFGGFGSMFVFLSGMPNIFKKVGYQQIAEIFELPEAKTIGLSLAIFITGYLAYFSIKSIYRLYKQEASIEDSEKKITEFELDLINANHLYSNVRKLLKEVERMKLVFNILKNIRNID